MYDRAATILLINNCSKFFFILRVLRYQAFLVVKILVLLLPLLSPYGFFMPSVIFYVNKKNLPSNKIQ